MTDPSGPFTGSAAHTYLPTTDEFITDEHGNVCPVLDTSQISFEHAVPGRKKETTRVVRARGDEVTSQEFEGLRESGAYIPKPGEAIFINGPRDIYVPSRDGTGRLKFNELEDAGYKIASSTTPDDVQVKSIPAKLLVGVVDARVVIKNAWGDTGQMSDHQFLSAGATLKQEASGRVTGMDKEGFKKWEVDPVPRATSLTVRPEPS